MDLLKVIKKMFKKWFGSKDKQNVENNNLKIQIKTLNSKLSHLTEQMEKIRFQQEEIILSQEQILFYTTGSFDTEECSDENIFEEKKPVNNRGNFRLN